MKSLLSTFALALLIGAATPVSAAQIGGMTPVGPTPYVPVVWRARVRYVNPVKHPNGTVSTYSYIDIAAENQTYCEGQLNSLTSTPGVVVDTWCWPDYG